MAKVWNGGTVRVTHALAALKSLNGNVRPYVEQVNQIESLHLKTWYILIHYHHNGYPNRHFQRPFFCTPLGQELSSQLSLSASGLQSHNMKLLRHPKKLVFSMLFLFWIFFLWTFHFVHERKSWGSTFLPFFPSRSLGFPTVIGANFPLPDEWMYALGPLPCQAASSVRCPTGHPTWYMGLQHKGLPSSKNHHWWF